MPVIQRSVCTILACFTLLGSAWGASPAILNYQGRITVDGANFNGEGLFVFSIENTNGAILWASGEFPRAGMTNLPGGVIRLPVKDGLYQVRLGDPASGMHMLDAGPLHAAADPFVRVWFNDGKHGWLPAAGEGRLKRTATASAQALPSATPTGVTTSKIATVPLTDTSPSLGRADAPLVLVEFIDFQCPYCKQVNDRVLPTLKKMYVDTGKLRIVSRNLPLWFHANAAPAAEAAFCAQLQSNFWPMRDRLFTNSEQLGATNFVNAAKALNLDLASFIKCLEQKTATSQLARDQQDAQAAGITATPSFVLGRPVNGKVTGPLLVGAKPAADFQAEIENLLATPP
ncbi:MAG: thioredoxin domain-containing protein [Verrucomicrobiota bacterium]|jgi:protein-disulfide isomerase